MDLYWKMSKEWEATADSLFETIAARLVPRPKAEADNPKLQIIRACAEVCAMLLYKNQHYGNSALEPAEIIPTGTTPVQGILIRINDKLKRLKFGTSNDEDTFLDIMGFLVLLRIAKHNESLPQAAMVNE